MQSYQREFLDFALRSKVLNFGQFTLKSGRVSPYFFNAGLFNNGNHLQKIGQYYARTLNDNLHDPFMLFGPAYKGIPLACAVAISLHTHYQVNVPFAFNRKEVKDHGEGGELVGAPLSGNVVIVDDVITAGTSVGQSIEIISRAGAKAVAIVIAIDRQEKLADNEQSAAQAVTERYGLPVLAIANMSHLIDYLQTTKTFLQHLPAIKEYRQRYGVSG